MGNTDTCGVFFIITFMCIYVLYSIKNKVFHGKYKDECEIYLVLGKWVWGHCLDIHRWCRDQRSPHKPPWCVGSGEITLSPQGFFSLLIPLGAYAPKGGVGNPVRPAGRHRGALGSENWAILVHFGMFGLISASLWLGLIWNFLESSNICKAWNAKVQVLRKFQDGPLATGVPTRMWDSCVCTKSMGMLLLCSNTPPPTPLALNCTSSDIDTTDILHASNIVSVMPSWDRLQNSPRYTN